MVKFLIIRFSSIGDIVLTTPVVRALKQQVKGAKIHYLTKKQYSGIVDANPYIDKVHAFDGDFNKTISELKNEFFDHIIDLHNNLRTARVKRNLPVNALTFDKLNWQKWLLVNFKKNKMPDIHIVDRYFYTTRFFDVKNDKKGLDYFIPDKDTVDIQNLPASFSEGYILFAIGAQHFTKRLPVEKIISICKKNNNPIIIAGGKEDTEIAKKIKNELGDNIYNACGKYNLNQSASLVKQAKLVITHDTGLMHIAAAFKKKIISVWGNTVPEFGMYPYLPHKESIIVEVEDLKCRPCSKIGFSQCPKKHFKCMNDIDEDIITRHIKSIK